MHKEAGSAENGQHTENAGKKDNFFNESRKLLENYVHDRILLLKLEVSKKAANVSAGIASAVALAGLALLALIFFSITLGFVFSKLTSSFIWGFGIVTAVYALLIVLVIMNKTWLKNKVSGAVISSMFSKKKENKPKDDVDTVSQN